VEEGEEDPRGAYFLIYEVFTPEGTPQKRDGADSF